MATDPTTLNPAAQADQHTAYVLTPSCVRCGYAGLSRRRDGAWRCDGCHRTVLSVEFAPKVHAREPAWIARSQRR